MLFIDDIQRFHQRLCRPHRAVGRNEQGQGKAQTLRGLAGLNN